MPPSAITGTPCARGDAGRSRRSRSSAARRRRRRRASCRSSPGPTPTLTASAPASTSASAASAVAMLPAMSSTSKRLLSCRAISSTPREWPCAVSTTSTSTPASTSASARSSASGPTPTAAPTRSRPALVLRRVRVLDPLLDVLDRDQALQAPVGVDDRQLLDPVAVEDRLRLLERRADRRGDEVAELVISSRPGCVGVAREAQVAVGEDPDEAALLVGDRDAGDVVALHQLERVGDAVVRAAA